MADRPVGPAAASLDELELFYGATSAAKSKVYARLPRPAAPGSWTLTGCLRGPLCDLAQTLPASHAFRDLGPGPTLLAGLTIEEPSFWSPRVPAWHQASLELRRDGVVTATVERMFGIRMLGASRASLYLEGRRWVVRAVAACGAELRDLASWRAAPAAAMVEAPDDELCERASREGVALIARLRGEQHGVLGELRRLSRWPAVILAALEIQPADASQLVAAAPNLLLGQWRRAEDPAAMAEWADAALVEASDDLSHFRGQAERLAAPVLAVRLLREPLPVAEARRACDALQRDLAPWIDCAGYCV